MMDQIVNSMVDKKIVFTTFFLIVVVFLPFMRFRPQTSVEHRRAFLKDNITNDSFSKHSAIETISSSSYPFATQYPSIQELYSWYDTVERNSICHKIRIGTSWEHRPLYALKISDNVEKDEHEPEVLIDGTIHAREWPSLQVATYFLWNLIESYDTNPTVHWTVNHRELFIVPLLNPDGYYYDGNGVLAESPGRYGWRKNARDNNHNGEFDSSVDGVDLNRNWDIHWGTTGASHYQNDSTYCGPSPFSEPEIRSYKQWILSRDIETYQNLHCFGGTLLHPWCFTTNPSPHQTVYQAVADDMTALTTTLGETGKKYSYDQAYEEIGYSASGGASDWIYQNTGAISLSFEIATGGYDFHPPTDMIMTINNDLFDACLYQARVANTDIGNNSVDLHPPVPYLIYGTIKGLKGVKKHTKIKITNVHTGETITTTTDTHGYYEFNLAALQRKGYMRNHTFKLTVAKTSRLFTIGAEWGQRKNIYLVHKRVNTTLFNIQNRSIHWFIICSIAFILVITLFLHYQKQRKT